MNKAFKLLTIFFSELSHCILFFLAKCCILQRNNSERDRQQRGVTEIITKVRVKFAEIEWRDTMLLGNKVAIP